MSWYLAHLMAGRSFSPGANLAIPEITSTKLGMNMWQALEP